MVKCGAVMIMYLLEIWETVEANLPALSEVAVLNM